MMSPLRLLVIADVGGATTRHIGDEAMLEANLAAFRRLVPDVALTVVSADPAWVASRYGVDAVAPFGFPEGASAAAERAVRLDALLADAEASGRSRRHATIDAVARADGVVISGGGCLSWSWPHLLYERAALLQLARLFGKPAVVIGQTIGPRLREDERRLLVDTLSSARFVGLRELPSIALAFGMGVPPARLWYQGDDATFLGDGDEAEDGERNMGASGNVAPALTIAVTIDPQLRAAGDHLFDTFARQLRDLSARTHASLVLIPHVFGHEVNGALSDLTESRRLMARLEGSRVVMTEALDAAQVRKVTGDAALVISTRYHPIVFGLAAGTACIGIYGDEYCRIKVQGALAHAKLERWTLTYDEVLGEKLLSDALGLWHLRDEVRRQLASQRAIWREEYRARWRAILRALDPAQVASPADPSTLFGRPLRDMTADLVLALDARRQAWQDDRGSFERLSERCDRAERRTRRLEGELTPASTIRRYAGSLLRRIGLRATTTTT